MDEYNIAQILAEIELELVLNLVNSVKTDFSAKKINAINNYKMRNQKILSKYHITSEVAESLKQAYSKGGQSVREEVHQALKSQNAGTFSHIDESKVNALINASVKDFNDAQKAVLRMMDDVYRRTIYKTQVELALNVLTVDEAIDKSTQSFLEQGINCIEYSDGKRVNVASWAEMSLRTTIRRAGLIGEGEERARWGIYTVLVSQYGACSKTCLPWQGRVYIDDVYSGGKPDGNGKHYSLLSTAIDNGLFHPNCRHRTSTYFEGINTIPARMENTVEVSEHEQVQRYNERQIRKYKRLETGSLTKENKMKYNQKVKQWQGVQRELMNKYPTELRRDYSREKLRV